jgi:hypothetical protein
MKAGFFSFGEQSRTNDVRRNAIDHWACAETPGFPQGVKERSHEPEAATMAVPAAATGRFVAAAMMAATAQEAATMAAPAVGTARFDAAAMMVARHFATARCHAKADQAGESL